MDLREKSSSGDKKLQLPKVLVRKEGMRLGNRRRKYDTNDKQNIK